MLARKVGGRGGTTGRRDFAKDGVSAFRKDSLDVFATRSLDRDRTGSNKVVVRSAGWLVSAVAGTLSEG